MVYKNSLKFTVFLAAAFVLTIGLWLENGGEIPLIPKLFQADFSSAINMQSGENFISADSKRTGRGSGNLHTMHLTPPLSGPIALLPGHSPRTTISGDFLVALVARNRHDWDTAGRSFQRLLESDPENIELRKWTMLLLLGSNQLEDAVDLASGFIEDKVPNDMAEVVLALHAVQEERYDHALSIVQNMQPGKESRIIQPLLEAWVKAGQGEVDVEQLVSNPLYLKDTVTITAYAGGTKSLESLYKKHLPHSGASAYDLERVGDVYAHKGLNRQAVALYESALNHPGADTPRLARKVSALQTGEQPDTGDYLSDLPVSAAAGLSRSVLDLAILLFRQGADSPARLYSSMALSLDPANSDARMLLAHILTSEGQIDHALEQYKAITKDQEGYKLAQRQSAEILAGSGKTESAVSLLEALERDFGDLEARVQIGDMFRRDQRYKAALQSYNLAFEKIAQEGQTYPNLWNLYYVRGITYERLNEMDKAEQDLEKALSLQPDNAYILNYLGYSLADQGRQLERAKKMLLRAVSLQPENGYITDSAGWVLYKTKAYDKAIPYLEKAVELLPYDAVINDHLGDAYWQVGRELEARFQWRRALNHAEDSEMSEQIKKKMRSGLKKHQEYESALKDSSFSSALKKSKERSPSGQQ